MVSRWGLATQCYLVIKLKKFTKCPAGQIVKYKLNNNKKNNAVYTYDTDRKVDWNLSCKILF